MRKMSKRSAAMALGVALSTLQEAISSGRVTWPPTGGDALRTEWLACSGDQGPDPLINRDSELTPAGTEAPAASFEGETRAEALRRRAIADANLRELELQRKRGKLCLLSSVEREWVNIVVACRSKLLGIHVRLKQQRPHLTLEDVAAIEAVVRESLEDLAESEGGRIADVAAKEAQRAVL